MTYFNRSISCVAITLILFVFIISCKKESGEKITASPETKKVSDTTYPLQPFGHDFYAAGINLEDDERDIKKILGSPKDKSVRKCDYIPLCATYTYPFGKLELEGEKEGYLYVIHISITSPGVYGPRKTQVGDDIDSVIKKFPNENHPIQNKQRKLYGDMNKIYEKSSAKGRREDFGYGVVTYNDQEEIIEVIYSDDGGGGFGGHLLTFKVKKDKVSEIIIFVQSV